VLRFKKGSLQLRIVAALLTFILVSIAATGLFASAATVGLTGTKLGANTEVVASCDSAVSVSWTTAYDNTIPGYKVTNVTVSGIDDTACAGASLSVTLANAAGTALGSAGPVTIDAASEAMAVTGTVSAELLENVSVVITGP
jgi:hypothetical protein